MIRQLLLLLGAGILTMECSAQISITGALPYSYSQNFNAFAGTAASLPTGWTATGSFTYRGNGNGSSNTGGVWAYGSGSDYSLGALCSGSSSPVNFRVTFVNNTGGTITGLDIAYDFEQCRWAGGNTNGFTVTQGGMGSASVSALSQNSASSGGTNTVTQTAPKSLSLTGLSIANGTTFYLNWAIADGAGSDNSVAIDNFTMTAVGAVANPPSITANPAAAAVCAGLPVSFTAAASNAASYQWQLFNGSSWTNISNAAPYSGATTTTLSISNSTGLNGVQYRLIASGSNGQAVSTAATLTVNEVPAVNLLPSGTAAFCAGDSLTLHLVDPNPAWSYQWLRNGNPVGGATDSTLRIWEADSWSLIAMSAQGCGDTSAAVVSNISVVNASVTAMGSLIFCTGDSVLLQAGTGAGFSYQWLSNGQPVGGATGSDYHASQSAGYAVVVTSSIGCSDTSAVQNVTANSAPPAAITAAGPLSFCQNGQVVLDAGQQPGLSYQWKRNGNAIPMATAPVYTATQSGDYTVTVSSGVNCSATSGAATVTVHSLPTAAASIAGTTAVCQGDSVLLKADTAGGYSYQWLYNNAMIPAGNQANYYGKQNGLYAVKVTDANSCTDTSSPLMATVYQRPNASISALRPLSFCAGDSTKLQVDGTANWQFQWINSSALLTGQTGNALTSLGSGAFSLIVTDSNGCRDTSNVLNALMNPLPAASVSAAGPTTLCNGSSVQLNANSGAGLSYRWKKDGSDLVPASTAVSHAAITSGSYSAVVKNNASGCSDSSSAIAVLVNPLPVSTATVSSGTAACEGDTVLVNANAGTGLRYQWLYNTYPTADTLINLRATVSGSYAVKVTDTNNCSSTSAVVSVLVNPVAAAVITYNSPLAFCEGSAVVLNVQSSLPASYQWMRNGQAIPGAVNDWQSIAATGHYRVRLTTPQGCISETDSIGILVYPKPQPLISQSGLTLSTGTFASWQWFWNNTAIAGASAGSLTISKNGAYHVVVTDSNGCTNQSATFVIMNVGITSAGIPQGGIYPNPARDAVYTSNSEAAGMQLVDLNGRILQHADGKIMHLENQAAGLYLVLVLDHESRVIERAKVSLLR